FLIILLSFLREQESIFIINLKWIPAFAGMTVICNIHSPISQHFQQWAS
ncbi:MAG: hypothetical protein ACJARX_001947, partial [Psychroserpens sp.]